MIEETINHKGRPMTTKLTAAEAWNRLPSSLDTNVRYIVLGDQPQRSVDRWFVGIVADINREKDTEIERLKARVAELERTATTSPPKPRRTAGEKLCDALVKIGQSFSWAEYDEKNKERMQSAAIELGLTDDPETPTDGELLRAAWRKHRHDHGADQWFTIDWEKAADEFLAKRAEREGGAT